jgi:hypothetical protein
MSRYFDEGKREIRLIVGRFDFDGTPTQASRFGGAPGHYFDAELEWIRPGGLQRAKVCGRRDIPARGFDWLTPRATEAVA